MTSLNKQDYLKKSKTQKTTAWVLVGGGIAMMAGAVLINLSDGLYTNSSKGIGLFYTGTATTLLSIPFFISSGKNKRKARRMSFNMLQVPHLIKTDFVNQIIPSLYLKVSL